jgi:hypothetical protein
MHDIPLIAVTPAVSADGSVILDPYDSTRPDGFQTVEPYPFPAPDSAMLNALGQTVLSATLDLLYPIDPTTGLDTVSN